MGKNEKKKIPKDKQHYRKHVKLNTEQHKPH